LIVIVLIVEITSGFALPIIGPVPDDSPIVGSVVLLVRGILVIAILGMFCVLMVILILSACFIMAVACFVGGMPILGIGMLILIVIAFVVVFRTMG